MAQMVDSFVCDNIIRKITPLDVSDEYKGMLMEAFIRLKNSTAHFRPMLNLTQDDSFGVHCMVLKFSQGVALAEYLPSAKDEDVVALIGQALCALWALEKNGIRHDDLKLDNVLVES
eukprot:scaffold42278_cov32-Tisochrysis_lutea.AAC.1